MQLAARPLSRLRRSLVARVLSGVLLSAGLSFACTAQASLRPISLKQQQQLQKLAATGDTAGLRALVQTLENGYDTEALPIFGVFRAILLSADDQNAATAVPAARRAAEIFCTKARALGPSPWTQTESACRVTVLPSSACTVPCAAICKTCAMAVSSFPIIAPGAPRGTRLPSAW